MSMSIAEQLVLLAELAGVDAKAKAVMDKLETVPAAAKKSEAAAQKLKAELDGLEQRKQGAQALKKKAESDIYDEKYKIKKWEARADELRGEREHAALSSEIGGAKKQIRRLEDDALVQMEVLEAAEKDLGSVGKKHATAASEAAEEWKKVDGDLSTLRAEAAGLGEARNALLQKLPASLVKRYETIANKRGGVGVAIIRAKNDTCSGCNRAVPAQLSIQVQKGQVLEGCASCNRLLVHESMTQAALPEG